MSITVPAGTRMYLMKNTDPSYALYIKPDTTLLNDNLYVAHDVKIGQITAIYKGTRVVGNWVTESIPVVAAQLQTTKIYLDRAGQDFFADSCPIQTVTILNPAEVDGVNTVFKNADYKSPSGITRRIVTVRNRTFSLPDDIDECNIAAGTYINISTREIPITVIRDLVISLS
jgi:hypothetical protein